MVLILNPCENRTTHQPHKWLSRNSFMRYWCNGLEKDTRWCGGMLTHVAHDWRDIDNDFAPVFHCSGSLDETEDNHRVAAQEPGMPRLAAISGISSEWWDQFREAYEAYGEGAADFQGIAGQWGDLYRKVMYLHDWAWAGGPEPTREPPRKVLLDIIGHAFLAIEMIDRDLPGGRS